MMNHTNGPIFNTIAWVTSIVMIVLTLTPYHSNALISVVGNFKA